MKRRRDNSSRNIFVVGLLLLVVFGASIFLIGLAINRIAAQMNNTIVAQSCQTRFNEMAFEFYRTEQLGNIAHVFIANDNTMSTESFNTISTTLLKLDPKVHSIWLYERSSGRVSNFHQHDSLAVATLAISDHQRQIVNQKNALKLSGSYLWKCDSLSCWTLLYEIKSKSSQTYLLGVDIMLSELYQYFANQPQTVQSYVSIIDRNGVTLLHPDSSLLGHKSIDEQEVRILKQVISRGVKHQTTVISEYIGMPVERIYYPLSINNQQLVVVVNIPHITINKEMSDFHRYTILIAIIAVVLFSVLLALSQARWRREYHLRRKAEQESLVMQLQQIVNQINPHFLFNSLNSLYVLIGKNKSLAREFILSLSRVYRHVLELGKEPFSTLDSEIKFIDEYYFLQKIRFNEQIELQIEIDNEFKTYRLPTMSVETVVENAIKHNQITHDNPLIIRIFILNQKLIIENNYTPREDAEVESFGVGLERINTIYKLYNKDQMVVINDGKIFRCELPLLS